MSLAVNNLILASDFIALKARIKAECARRQYNGSVAQYASATYDYTVSPESGNAPLPEHYNKIIVPYNALTGSKLATKSAQNIIPALQSVSDGLAVLEQISVDSDSSGCKSSCTGLCQGTCASGCTSCTGSCANSCTSCTGGCTGSCTDGCTDNCTDACAFNCSSYCANSCYTSCSEGCLNACKGSCKGAVTGSPS